jgi:sugar phosphate isomerase/epimerase
MPLSTETWPIAAALLSFPAIDRYGVEAQTAAPEVWMSAFRQVVRAGFDNVDLIDTWVRIGDLSPDRLRAFIDTAHESGLSAPAVSLIRRSVIHAQHGEQNLAYSHRSIDAAAAIGAQVVSVGLHQELTAQQREQLWFWTVDGHHDDPSDSDAWNAAVTRLRELGEHANEVGVLLSLEMYEDTYLGTADSAVRLVEEIGQPSVGLNPDTGNLLRLHRPIEDWRSLLESTLPYTNYWHMKNYQRDEDRARDQYVSTPSTMEGGVINYREAIQIAIDCGFQGVLCCEQYGGDGLSMSATNQRYLRSILPETEDYELGTSRRTQVTDLARHR